MKRLWIAGTAVAGLFAGGYAMAQETTLTIAPEQRTVIHDYVVKEHVRPAQVREEVSVGVAIPQGVELQPVPEEIYTKVPDARRYKYFDWNGRVVFVDPGSRKVVQIVD
ncbi:MAG TPA: DUF1236 domain-containing protein [Rhizomicrobium sp.]|nr:DUF1236 domain-containing protein [Rhizomicrobium sp.]